MHTRFLAPVFVVQQLTGAGAPMARSNGGVRYFFPNGSAIMAYRASTKRWPSAAEAEGEAGEAVGLAFCANWSGPCEDLTPDVPALSAKSNCAPPNEPGGGSCEDMAIWPDHRGSWHMLTHTRHHYASRLGGPWSTSPTESLPGGKPAAMWCGLAGGARPQIVLRPGGGGLRYLSSACKSGAMTRNFVQEIRGPTSQKAL